MDCTTTDKNVPRHWTQLLNFISQKNTFKLNFNPDRVLSIHSGRNWLKLTVVVKVMIFAMIFSPKRHKLAFLNQNTAVLAKNIILIFVTIAIFRTKLTRRKFLSYHWPQARARTPVAHTPSGLGGCGDASGHDGREADDRRHTHCDADGAADDVPAHGRDNASSSALRVPAPGSRVSYVGKVSRTNYFSLKFFKAKVSWDLCLRLKGWECQIELAKTIMVLLHVCIPWFAPLTNFVYIFCIHQKDRNVDRNFLMYQCKIGQKHHCCNQKFWSIFSTTFTQIGKTDNKQRSQKTSAYGDTFVKKAKVFVLETELSNRVQCDRNLLEKYPKSS
jgi:hypothetical protein